MDKNKPKFEKEAAAKEKQQAEARSKRCHPSRTPAIASSRLGSSRSVTDHKGVSGPPVVLLLSSLSSEAD